MHLTNRQAEMRDGSESAAFDQLFATENILDTYAAVAHPLDARNHKENGQRRIGERMRAGLGPSNGSHDGHLESLQSSTRNKNNQLSFSGSQSRSCFR